MVDQPGVEPVLSVYALKPKAATSSRTDAALSDDVEEEGDVAGCCEGRQVEPGEQRVGGLSQVLLTASSSGDTTIKQVGLGFR